MNKGKHPKCLSDPIVSAKKLPKCRSKRKTDQGSVLYSLVFTIILDEIIASARKCLLKEILCAHDLVLMSENENIEELQKKFHNGKRMKVDLGKTKVMASGSEGEMTMSRTNP